MWNEDYKDMLSASSVASVPHSIRNKLAVGRPKDLDDARLLQEHLRKPSSNR
jgi:hypothetical protein